MSSVITRSKVRIDSPETRKRELNTKCGDPFITAIANIPKASERRVESRILIDSAHKLAYCNVPKVGSSFWYSLFAILTGNLTANVTSPYVIAEYYGPDLQRDVPVKYMNRISSGEKQSLLDEGLMFLFVRDPYRRLYSAYIDKLLIPNHYYWMTTGKILVRQMRPNAKKKARECGHDVTFEEFLRFFIVSETSEKIFKSDHHWTPVYKLCAPCHYPYRIIGKTETFIRDTTAIINNSNLTSVIDFGQNEQTHIKADIMQTISNFLNNSLSPKLNACTNLTHDVDRLWDAFKAKGYMRHDTRKPIILEKLSRKTVSTLKRTLFDQVFNVYKEQYFPGSRSNYSDTSLATAYSRVSTNILYLVRDILLPDLLLFNYDPEPTLLFHR